MQQKKYKVAVYGTLRQGFGNHRVMEMSNGKFLGNSKIDATMYSYGPFPVIEIGTNNKVHCEIYEVEDMHHLDRLEGYPRFYDRSEVKTSDGEIVWVYHIPENNKNELNKLPVVESGIWN